MKKNIVLFILILLSFTLSAQNALDSFVNCDLLRNANVSLMVKDLNSGKVLYAYRANNAAKPASTLKTITTSTALELLGGDFQFKTKLQYSGKISKKGVLAGNLYIKGDGDPTLGSEFLGDTLFLNKWVEEIKKAGIKKIEGNIIADESEYDMEGVNPHWTWQDIGNYYGAGAYGISYKDNMYRVFFNTGVLGSIPEISRIVPYIEGLNIENHLITSNVKSDESYLYGAPRSNERSIWGELPANEVNFPVKGDIPRPGELLVNDLKKLLAQNKVKTEGKTEEEFTNDKTSRTTIYTHFSPALRDIVKAINVPSNNHFAEHLFRHLALLKDSVATTETALQVIRDFWDKKGAPINQLFMVDGCGLSPENAVSAQFYIYMLSYLNDSKSNIDFRNSLPIAGKTGTAKYFLDNTSLEGKVIAKSGSINRVRCYVGYIDTPDKNWAFAILVNNPNGTSTDVTHKMEDFLVAITK